MAKQLSVVFFAALWTLFADGNEIQLYGIKGKSVQLLCDVPVSEPPVVEWSDMVYTSDTNPSIIFQTENNPHFRIESTHENRDNYVVHRNFSLTIDLLDLDLDPGLYMCHSTVDGITYERHYYLTVGDPPICSGDVHLFEGNSTTLACQLEYSGQKPSLQWFRDGEEVESGDEYEIRLAKKVISVLATADQDQTKYTCSMSLGQHTEDCILVLDVKYLVRDLRLTPAKEKFRVGDELQCSAKGNPAPSVSLLPSLLPVHAKSGPGWTTLSISQKWEGQRVNIQCTASNTVGSVTEIQSSNLTIHVSAPRKSHTTAPGTVIEKSHAFQHHIKPSSTAQPTFVRRDKDQTKSGGHQKKPHRQHHHHPTTAPTLTEDEFPDEDNENIPVRIPVTQKTTLDKLEPPENKKIDLKDTQVSKNSGSPEVAGAKSVQSEASRADQTNNLGLFSSVIFILFNLVLTIY